MLDSGQETQASNKAGISRHEIQYVVATGVGRKYIRFAQEDSPEFLCLAKGIHQVLPSTRTLLDLGAQKSLVVKCNEGKVTKFISANRCATDTGTYLEIVGNVLGLKIDELANLPLKAKQDLKIQATCTVFVESEIISLIHGGENPEVILVGAVRGMAQRIYSQLLEAGLEKDVVMVGGVAKIRAAVKALAELVGHEILVPDNPDIVSALGAAIIAEEKTKGAL